jgi:hypothetical protein
VVFTTEVVIEAVLEVLDSDVVAFEIADMEILALLPEGTTLVSATTGHTTSKLDIPSRNKYNIETLFISWEDSVMEVVAEEMGSDVDTGLVISVPMDTFIQALAVVTIAFVGVFMTTHF